MPKENHPPLKNRKGLKTIILLVIVLLLIVGIPFLLISYQAKQKGMSRREVINRIINKTGSKDKYIGKSRNC